MSNTHVVPLGEMATSTDGEMCSSSNMMTSRSTDSPRHTALPSLPRSHPADIYTEKRGRKDTKGKDGQMCEKHDQSRHVQSQEQSGQKQALCDIEKKQIHRCNEQAEQGYSQQTEHVADYSGEDELKSDINNNSITTNNNLNPLVHAATSTVNGTGGCKHKGVDMNDFTYNTHCPVYSAHDPTSPARTFTDLPVSASHCADLQDQDEDQESEGNQVVLVRLKTPPDEGSEVKATKKTPVCDLVNQCPDLSEVQLEPVAIDGSVYNRWARLPRDEDPDSEESSNPRRPLTMRMLQYSGSLKAVSLMQTIARTNPDILEPPSAFPPHFKAGMPPSPSFPAAPPVPECRRQSEVTSSRSTTREDMGPFGLSSRVADYLPFLTNQRNGGRSRGEVIAEGSEMDCAGVLSAPCSRRLRTGCTGEKSKEDVLKDWTFCKNVQSLPMNKASLLFSQEVDMRDKRYSYVKKRLQFRPSIHSANENSPTNGAPLRTAPKSVGNGKDNSGQKQTEVKRVQFIDLAEVKQVLLQKRGGGSTKPRCESELDFICNRSAYTVSARSLRSGVGGSYGGGYRHAGKRIKGITRLHQPFIPVGLPFSLTLANNVNQ